MSTAPPERFHNEGFGWICRNCERADREAGHEPSRLMTEGEAEEKNTLLSTTALAKWADRSRGVLECPTCGATETVTDNR